jgi:Ca2+/H+ antiporter, TMEM165/GDT1 family
MLAEALDTVFSSFLTVLVTELGDKTFISTAMLAMRYPKSAVLLGNFSSMTLMMLLASSVGYTIMLTISPTYVKLFSVFIFLYFSFTSFLAASDSEKSPSSEPLSTKPWLSVVWTTMVLVFFAEWGDKSQISIIALSANHPIIFVMLGTSSAILLCGLLAILCGHLFHQHVSETFMSYLSGLIFLFFGLFELRGFVFK